MMTEEAKNGTPAMDRTCTLMITHQCNLNCTYCYENFKSSAQMPLALAKQLIESEMSSVAANPRFSGLIIDFIGGEPLICFDLIAELAEWVWAEPREVPYMFFATTNGTLLDERKKKWFRKHKEKFQLGLSLDGPEAIQEVNRKGSFSSIDIDFFRELWPSQGVKMTISREGLKTLAHDVLYLQNLGLVVNFYPAVGIDWTDADADLYEQQLRILAEHYLKQKMPQMVSLFALDFDVLLEKTKHIQKFCGTGTYMVTYDVDGTAYPCHMFTPVVLGENCSEDLKKYNFYTEDDLVDQNCKACPLLRICPTCYGFNYKYRKAIAARDSGTCKMFKRQVLAAHYFQVELLMKEGLPDEAEGLRQAKILVNAADLMQSMKLVM